MITSALIPTAHAEKYIIQLARHWGHKFDVTEDAGTRIIDFGKARCYLSAERDSLKATIETPRADVDKLETVVADHLNRFAHREGPLSFHWSRLPE
ncbi:DUF2218 domain-containing protein [Hyphomonas sp.]|uniref:DUF2218 domain-containing protein n=1 Tax=Hyphomonas sp. TaxID=87 RepID=UPI0035276B90